MTAGGYNHPDTTKITSHQKIEQLRIVAIFENIQDKRFALSKYLATVYKASHDEQNIILENKHALSNKCN